MSNKTESNTYALPTLEVGQQRVAVIPAPAGADRGFTVPEEWTDTLLWEPRAAQPSRVRHVSAPA